MGVTVIIIGLMLVLLGMEQKFDGRLKFVALLQSNITSLKQYETIDKKISYKLPAEWVATPQTFDGSGISYHNDFISEDSIIHGSVEVSNLKEDLKTFLDTSKKSEDEYNTYKEYNINTIKINNEDGYLLEYTATTNAEVFYKTFEYYIKDKGKIFRFSFFVREPNFKENMPTIFKTIVETIKTIE